MILLIKALLCTIYRSNNSINNSVIKALICTIYRS